VTAQISERTGHLPGVAIAIMGCIVNGPGEMADADFGYVGGAPGKVRTWHRARGAGPRAAFPTAPGAASGAPS
jgi:4-hydroxy-3-methylbut-2-en-1-yl diphosphate synthase IspG/GcpE